MASQILLVLASAGLVATGSQSGADVRSGDALPKSSYTTVAPKAGLTVVSKSRTDGSACYVPVAGQKKKVRIDCTNHFAGGSAGGFGANTAMTIGGSLAGGLAGGAIGAAIVDNNKSN
jgi:hypothetical protein